MRAFHMPSLPEMPYEHLQENNNNNNNDIGQISKMKLKVLYTLDDNTFLARSNILCDVKTAKIPIPGQSGLMTLGVVSIRSVLLPILYSSPELFGDASIDYSVYVKDISEEDEPFVGHGLFTKLIAQNFGQFEDEVLIPGRVCSNFAALLSNRGGSGETLEIKLRLARVRSNRQSNRDAGQQHQQQSSVSLPPPQQPVNKRQRDSSDTEDENEEFRLPKKIQPEFQTQQRQRKPSTSSTYPTRVTNSNPAPKAVRTQSLPAFNNPLNQVILPNGALPYINNSGQRYPRNTIAHRIRQADNANSGKVTYNFHVDGIDEKNAPIGITTEVSKRFADDFITKKSGKKNQLTPAATNTTTTTTIKRNDITAKAQSSPQPQLTKIASKKDKPNQLPSTTNTTTAPTCINCKTNESKAWRWNEADEEFKRGLFCNNCYIYLIDKGVMRPSYLFKKRSKSQKKKAVTSSTISAIPNTSSSAASTPSASKIVSNQNTTQAKMNNLSTSSDIIEDFNEMMGSDLDFHFGPMTDIDPLPQQQQLSSVLPPPPPPPPPPHHHHESLSEEKENIPPQQALLSSSSDHTPSQAIPIKRASRQNSFEKMLAKSFSGAPPNVTNTPSEWMSEFFEPTPRDQDENTPKDFENNTPKDLATCNTIPCEDESPQPDSDDQSKEQQHQQQQHQQLQNTSTNPQSYELHDNNRTMNKMKVSTMPSSPFTLQMGDTSSPNSMHDNSDWLSEHTKLSSMDNEISNDHTKKANAEEEFTADNKSEMKA